MNLARKASCIVLCLCTFQSHLSADHLPPSEIANGKAEHLLAGISIKDGTVASAVKQMGSPDKFKESTSEDLSGERSYEWDRKGVRVQMGTEFYTDKLSKTLVESPPLFVDVWGSRDDSEAGATGSGLGIGDDLAKVKSLYGDRFQRGTHSITIQWRDETTLVIDFSNDNRIEHMQLYASQE